MEKFVIVIGRQYGAGGRRLGKRLAKELHVSYYDKELLSEAASSMGYTTEIFTNKDEKRPSFLRSLLSFTYGNMNDTSNPDTLSDENIYRLQSDVISKIAERESCIIVGRTADYILRNHPHLISIFIHAPESHRTKALVERNEAETLETAASMIHKKDNSRESYYNFFTNRHWGKADNYDFSFDSSKISEDSIVTLILNILNK